MILISVCNFLVRCSVYIVCPSVLSCNNLKLHQILDAKNIFKQENVMLQVTVNPGLTSTGFRTTCSYHCARFADLCMARRLSWIFRSSMLSFVLEKLWTFILGTKQSVRITSVQFHVYFPLVENACWPLWIQNNTNCETCSAMSFCSCHWITCREKLTQG